MADIVCYHCFAKFPPGRLRFKCTWHKEHDRILGPKAPLIFDPPRPFWRAGPSRREPCPVDHLLTSDRVCPNCHRDLPYYVGRAAQEIIAVTGCQASGKTLYHLGLLHRLREQLARDPRPYAVAMFEDDLSFRYYQDLVRTILVQHKLPRATRPGAYLRGELQPIIVRLLREHRRGMCNLIFYDHPGELVEAIEKAAYLRYLAHASAIIYLVDPTGAQGTEPQPDAVDLAAHALAVIAGKLRRDLGLGEKARIGKKLAVAITKADRTVFPRHPAAAVIGGLGRDQEFWRRPSRADRAEADRASRRCEELAREMKLDSLVNAAQHNFRAVRFFAVSSFHAAGGGDGAEIVLDPVGVEHPLFWTLS